MSGAAVEGNHRGGADAGGVAVGDMLEAFFDVVVVGSPVDSRPLNEDVALGPGEWRCSLDHGPSRELRRLSGLATMRVGILDR